MPEALAVLFATIVFLFVYFIPSFIAVKRGHLNRTPIILVNIFLGWSLVAWFFVLIWSFTSHTEKNRRQLLVD